MPLKCTIHSRKCNLQSPRPTGRGQRNLGTVIGITKNLDNNRPDYRTMSGQTRIEAGVPWYDLSWSCLIP